MSVENAVIAGAGIAGLTTAIALAQRGVRVHIIEQAEVLSEVGAGLQVSANGARILDQLGVLKNLSNRWTEPENVTLASGRSLRDLTSVPMGATGKRRWGAPYGVMHRASLQSALFDAAKAEPNIRFHLGQRLETPSLEVLRDITGETPQLIVGADGVWSRVRHLVPGAGKAQFSGYVAWRFVIPAKDAPRFIPLNRVTAYTGPHAHMVVYPLRETNSVNLVAISAGKDPGQLWSIVPTEEQRKAFVSEALSGWNPGIKELLLKAPTPTWWPLFGATDGRWTDGESIALVGDAAHAMLPFAAQGAVMAIEDAYELATLVTSLPLKEALRQYESKRKPRVTKVKARGDFNRFAYHARGPVKLARNIVFTLTPGSRLAADLDWIYGYHAGA